MDLSPRKVGVVAGVVFLILMTNAFHEAGHAVVAWWCGDRRPEIRRRISLNPLKHANWFNTFVLPLVSYWILGWPLGGAEPVRFEVDAVGARKMALVGIAGSVGNAIFGALTFVAGALAIRFGLIDEIDRVRSPVYEIVKQGMFYSAFIILINLVPFPPSDGSRIVGAFLPEPVRRFYFALAPIGIVFVFGFALWVTGSLRPYFPSLGPGYGREIAQAQGWMYERMNDLADYFGA